MQDKRTSVGLTTLLVKMAAEKMTFLKFNCTVHTNY